MQDIYTENISEKKIRAYLQDLGLSKEDTKSDNYKRQNIDK